MQEKQKIKSFTDLDAWKYSHQLVISVYKITKNFPKEETYSLIDQMKRSSVSVSSNIAEGFSRHTTKEKIQFYLLAEQTVRVHKLLNGLIRSLSPKY